MSDTSPTPRRDQILALLREAGGSPVSGEDLGERFGIGRTAICHDVAVLRAEGHAIAATPRGYVLESVWSSGVREVVAVRHSLEQTEEELCGIVDAGVTVADVVVDHPVYGEIRGNLQIRGRDEVAEFVASLRSGRVQLLSSLTDGFHTHTLWAADLGRIERAKTKLRALGMLRGDNPDTEPVASRLTQRRTGRRPAAAERGSR